MFIEIDNSVDIDLDSGIQSAIDLIDVLFTAHRMGNIILALRPNQVVKYRDMPQLSGASRNAVGQVSNRLNEYRAAMKIALRYITLCSPSVESRFSFAGKSARVSYGLTNLNHLLTQKFFLAEAQRDITILEILSQEFFSTIKYPELFVRYRPLIGGGGSCHHVLNAELISPSKGLAICDRDSVKSVPPFKPNSTAQKVHQTAKALNLIGENLGVSDISPFFGLDVTWGRTIENMIGPNLLDVYLLNNGNATERKKFTSAFTDFPKLSSDEQIFWRDLNLKDGTKVVSEQISVFKAEIGPVPPLILGKLKAFSQIRFPDDALDWIISNQVGSRWSKDIKSAIRRDFQFEQYRLAIERFALPLLTLAAGDYSAQRS